MVLGLACFSPLISEIGAPLAAYKLVKSYFFSELSDAFGTLSLGSDKTVPEMVDFASSCSAVPLTNSMAYFHGRPVRNKVSLKIGIVMFPNWKYNWRPSSGFCFEI